MKRPAPRFATWLLARLGDRYRRDALIGDLAEEYQRGRSSSWYWRQALCALAASGRRALWPMRPGLGLLIWWWSLLAFATFAWKWPIFIFVVDPSPYLLYHKRKRRRNQSPCVP